MKDYLFWFDMPGEHIARRRCSFHDQTFSRCRSELKMHFRTFAELKIDMLNSDRASVVVAETTFEISWRWIVRGFLFSFAPPFSEERGIPRKVPTRSVNPSLTGFVILVPKLCLGTRLFFETPFRVTVLVWLSEFIVDFSYVGCGIRTVVESCRGADLLGLCACSV